MKKEELLKYIAKVGYNVGFGAKKHFATYDIVEKIPAIIGMVSIAVGIFALINDFLARNTISATFIVLGIVGLSISVWDAKKHNYDESGAKLTNLYNELEKLYQNTKSANDKRLTEIESRVGEIQIEYSEIALSKQILFANCFAHYKFFWEHQIDWLDEQLHFKLFRDKIPLSLTIWVSIIVITSVGIAVFNCAGLKALICG